MNILFIHQNFPGQFQHLAPALARNGHNVVALHMGKKGLSTWQDVKMVSYSASRGTSKEIHPWAGDFETKIIRGEACLAASIKLKKAGFTPDKIIAHHGWGESLFVKQVWPNAALGIYCEFYYEPNGLDVDFDPEFSTKGVGEQCRVLLKNINNLLHFPFADAGISPTSWQASTFPEHFREKIAVIHDGIDTSVVRANKNATFKLPNGTVLNSQNEVITFVNRNFEPYRGYHIFMRSLPEILKLRKDAIVVLVGGEGVSYGAPPNAEKYGNKTWKQIFIDEVAPNISPQDFKRVAFVGELEYERYICLLQLSSVHVYLTFPFVLSWSLMEAMSIGCPIIASDTPPVAEVIHDGITGLLVDFFDHKRLAFSINELLNDPCRSESLSKAASEFIRSNYDLNDVCLPKQIEWVNSL